MVSGNPCFQLIEIRLFGIYLRLTIKFSERCIRCIRTRLYVMLTVVVEN